MLALRAAPKTGWPPVFQTRRSRRCRGYNRYVERLAHAMLAVPRRFLPGAVVSTGTRAAGITSSRRPPISRCWCPWRGRS